MEFGKRLKSIRESKKISIYRLSQETNISQGHISDLENGKNQPTIETLKKLIAPLGISLSEFFNEDGNISILSEKERELIANFRTMTDENADLYFQLGKALNNK